MSVSQVEAAVWIATILVGVLSGMHGSLFLEWLEKRREQV